ncbi:hypothetical protein Nepgr_034000 [Nepenthes gracilis]|uniref:Uncharacterized protein n=1 Tax=Nepenthes gracilis TaxID=150966 RepID=A0AAD3TMT1_NEPGR|nr:hypothetical protein Nepgr_034000 [Nepenthes gracilis]
MPPKTLRSTRPHYVVFFSPRSRVPPLVGSVVVFSTLLMLPCKDACESRATSCSVAPKDGPRNKAQRLRVSRFPKTASVAGPKTASVAPKDWASKAASQHQGSVASQRLPQCRSQDRECRSQDAPGIKAQDCECQAPKTASVAPKDV